MRMLIQKKKKKKGEKGTFSEVSNVWDVLAYRVSKTAKLRKKAVYLIIVSGNTHLGVDNLFGEK